MSTTIPRTFLVSSFLAICVLASGGCDSDPGAEPPAGADPKVAPRVIATRVEAAVVEPGAASLRLIRPGEIEPAREAQLAAPFGGLVEQLKVDVGDELRKGALIAKIDTRMQSAQLNLAKVEVREAARELVRLRSLGSSIPKVRIDNAQTRMERASAQHRIAQIRLSQTVIRAPFAGVVAAMGTERGEVAAPGAPIVQLVQLDPAKVSVALADRDVAGLKIGDVALVTTGAQAQALAGTVTRIEPTANEKTRAFRAEVSVTESAGQLKPGMIARVEFSGVRAEGSLVIPQELLVTQADGNGVFVVDNNSVARWRPLTLGAIIGKQVVVEAGLLAGEKLVTLGHRGLSDGDALIVTREGKCCVEGRILFGADDQLARTKASATEGETTP